MMIHISLHLCSLIEIFSGHIFGEPKDAFSYAGSEIEKSKRLPLETKVTQKK